MTASRILDVETPAGNNLPFSESNIALMQLSVAIERGVKGAPGFPPESARLLEMSRGDRQDGHASAISCILWHPAVFLLINDADRPLCDRKELL